MDRQQVTLEANRELMDLARQVGQALGLSTASVVDRLLLDALERFAAGEVDFDGYLQPTDRGRYRWTVEIEPNGLGERVGQRLTIT